MKICPLCQKQYEDAQAGFCALDGRKLVEQANEVTPLSASLAMALFSHHFIENVPPESGTLSFCQPNVEVSSWKLVTELPIIAFWYLCENNCLRFTPVVKQGFFKNNMTLVIEANHASQVHFPGLEYDFLEIIKRSPPGVTVETVFKQFLGACSSEPEIKLIKRLIEWMIQLGYGQPDTSPKPFFRFSGRIHMFEKFAPDCQRIAIHEQAAQSIHNRWMKFRVEQSDVFYYLFEDIISAAINRVGNSKIHSSHYWHAESMRR
jgi:hypothetical protein